MEHKYFKDNNGKPKDSWYHNRLFDGDFAPLQAKRFFSRYDLLIHQPNTESGFSATLFGEKRKQINSKTKEKSYTAEYGYINYILAFRGTEMSSFKDLFVADASLAIGSIPRQQYDDMINFYETCASNYPQIKEKDSLTLTGHSLGGALAQMLALSLCDDKNRNNIKALCTYNAPGASALYPPYFAIFDITKYPNGLRQHFYVEIRDMLFCNIQGTRYEHLSKSSQFESILRLAFDTCYNEQERYLDKVYGIELINTGGHTLSGYIPQITKLNEIYYNKSRMPYYQMLLENFTKYIQCEIENKKKEKKEEKRAYKLSIHDSIHHCESSNNEYKNEWYMGSPISKLGIKLGLHQDNQYSDTTLLHAINTGSGTTGDHSIIPLTRTLYLYSYFLELDANNTMLESKLQSNNDKEKLSECLYTLNVFMGDIKTAMSVLVYEIDKKNKEKYEKFKKQIKWYQSAPNYDGIDYLALFISQVNELAFKIETLKEDNNKYFTSSIDIHTIIDTILKLQEHNYLIEIIDNDKLRAMRNQCKADNKASITEKLSLETCQPFRLVDKNNISYLNENNLHQIFGYKDLGHILSQEWHEEYINGRYKIVKGLYFGGNTISSLSKYVRDEELQIS